MNTQMLLENMVKLSCKITVYIPSTVNINQQIDNTQYVDKCATLFADCFGGATSTETLGYWTSPTMGLVKERSTMVFAYCTTDQASQHFDKVYMFCKDMKKELAQDSIALEYNGEMYFI